MVNVVYFATSLICFIPLQFVDCQKYVGDLCTLQSTGGQGQCLLLEKCQAAIQDLQSGIFPHTCGYNSSQPIVCCDGGALVTRPHPTVATTRSTRTARTTPTTTATTAKPVTQGILRVGDKSRQKCKEYSKYIEEEEYFVSGIGHISTEDCAFPALLNVFRKEISKPKEFPHMALIGFDDGSGRRLWQCGGSLISESFVLTAGHCLYHKQYGEPRYIRLGELILNTNTDDAEPQEFDITEKIRHPDYKPPSQYNDIALLKLNKDAFLNPYVRPACVNSNPGLQFNFAFASGWDKMSYTSGSIDHLQKVILEYFTHAECNDSYKNNIGVRLRYGIVDESQMCAGIHKEVIETCQGDSGGPLQIINTEEICMYTIRSYFVS